MKKPWAYNIAHNFRTDRDALVAFPAYSVRRSLKTHLYQWAWARRCGWLSTKVFGINAYFCLYWRSWMERMRMFVLCGRWKRCALWFWWHMTRAPFLPMTAWNAYGFPLVSSHCARIHWIHVNAFLSDVRGHLALDDWKKLQLPSLPAETCVIMHPGTQHDDFWEAKNSLKQMKERAILICEA